MDRSDMWNGIDKYFAIPNDNIHIAYAAKWNSHGH